MKKYNEIISDIRIFDVSEIPLSDFFGCLVKLPECGTCSVIWSENDGGWNHVSVSPKHKFKIPSWNDMCILKDIFFYDEEEVYQIHPKKSEYVNLKSNCLHMWKPIGHEIGELVNKGGMI